MSGEFVDPATQRDFERWQAKRNRPLSDAEQRGWRRFWDGWVICPACIAVKDLTPETWAVPANYDTPIKPDEACMKCKAEQQGGQSHG